MKVNRRQFLGALLGISLLSVPGLEWLRTGPAEGAGGIFSGPNLASLLKHPNSAKVIGRAYLQEVPGEANAPLLVNLICSGLAVPSRQLGNAEPEKLRRWLQLRMRQDFAEGQVVRLRGWIISVTEARLCSLAALV